LIHPSFSSSCSIPPSISTILPSPPLRSRPKLTGITGRPTRARLQ
jgi:hypothetical protein